MFRTPFGLLLIVLSLSGLADTERLWVLGSFANDTNAQAERDRLAATLGVDIEVRFDEAKSLFRVTAPADTVSREALGDRDTWLLTLDTPNPGTTPVLRSVPASEQTAGIPETGTAGEQPAASEATPLYPPFEARETLSEYCTRLPDTSLCQHPRTRQILDKDRKLSSHRRRELSACDQIVDPDRRKTCEE